MATAAVQATIPQANARAGYCETCLANGHQCLAYPGSTQCIFCEDGVPCPILRRNPKPVVPAYRPTRVAQAPARKSVVDKLFRASIAESRQREIGKDHEVTMKQAKSRTCDAPDCNTGITVQNKSGYCARHFYLTHTKGARGLAATVNKAQPARKAIRQLDGHARMCSCGCGGELHGRWPYLEGHGGTKGSKMKLKLQPSPAISSSSEGSNGGERTVASLLVTREQIIQMFSACPFQDQVGCVQAWLNGNTSPS